MDLKLPPLGEGVDSGSVVSILVKEGETVQKGQGIIELETGKAVAPVPASAAGKVTKIIVAVGDKISVGQPILSLEAGAAPAKPAAAKTRACSRASRVPARARRRQAFAGGRNNGGRRGTGGGSFRSRAASSPTIRRMAQ